MQHEQLGTGHAVAQTRSACEAEGRQVLILSGDVPLLTVETLRAFREAHEASGATLSLLGTAVDDPTGYGRILRESRSPQELLRKICAPGFLEQDQWQAHIQALVQSRAEVYVRSDGLTDDQIRASLLRPCRRIEGTITDLLGTYGRDASICVMPEGPQTIPYIA